MEIFLFKKKKLFVLGRRKKIITGQGGGYVCNVSLTSNKLLLSFKSTGGAGPVWFKPSPDRKPGHVADTYPRLSDRGKPGLDIHFKIQFFLHISADYFFKQLNSTKNYF